LGRGFSFPSVTRDPERKRVEHHPCELPKAKHITATLWLCVPRRYGDMGNSPFFSAQVARALFPYARSPHLLVGSDAHVESRDFLRFNLISMVSSPIRNRPVGRTFSACGTNVTAYR
jgi:hypothetical protein